MLKKFGKLLAQKRKEAHLSIFELPAMTGVTEARLEAWEQFLRRRLKHASAGVLKRPTGCPALPKGAICKI